MTVSNDGNRAEFTGDGTSTDFTFPFLFLDEASLVVIKEGITQTLNSDYTVDGVGAPAGGDVSFTTAPASGDEIIIYRDPVVLQPLDLVENDRLPAEPTEEAFDKLTLIAQRLKDRMDRSMRVADAHFGAVDTEIPSPEANQYLGWNDDADALVNITAPAFDNIENTAKVDSVADLRAATFPAETQAINLLGLNGSGTFGGGLLFRDASDTTTADDGETVIVDADGVRWKRDSLLRVQRENSVADLRAATYPDGITWLHLLGYNGAGTSGGGSLYRDNADTTTADNGGTVFVDADGVRWKRNTDKGVSLEDFGLPTGGDDLTQAQAAIDAAISDDFPIIQSTPIRVEISAALVASGTATQRLQMRLDRDVEFALTAADFAVLRVFDLGEFNLRGGTFDANGQITASDSHIIGFNNQFEAANNMPTRISMEEVTAIGPSGDSPAEGTSTRGGISFSAATRANEQLDIKVHRCTVKNGDVTRGTGIFLETGTGYVEGSRVSVSENVIEDVYQGIRLRGIRYKSVERNTLRGIGERAITVFGKLDGDKPILEDETAHVVGNSILHDISDLTLSRQGIVFGINAGVVLCEGNNCHSGDTTLGRGIASDVILSSGESDRRVRPSSVIVNNTVQGYRECYYSNDSYVIFTGNRAFNPGDFAFYSSEGSRLNIYYDGNYCQGANARIGFRPLQAEGDARGVFNSPIIGNNVFVDVEGAHIVRGENSGLLIASRPRAVADDLIVSSGFTGVHADIYELDTSAGAQTRFLPPAFIVPPGSRFRAHIKAGSDTFTFDPRNRSFVDTDVSTANNSITLSTTTAQERITGSPIRFGGAGALPAPLEKTRVYYSISGLDKGLTANDILVADTKADADAGTEIDLTTTGDATSNTVFDLLFDKSGTELTNTVLSSQGEMLDLVSGAACWWVM